MSVNNFFTQENLKSFYPGVLVEGFYKTVYQIFEDLPEVDYNVISITPNNEENMSLQYSEILEEEFWVVGLRHHYYSAGGLSIGDELELRKEPDNPFDSNAIAVYYKDKLAGYISKGETEDVHELMALGDNYRFYISSEPTDTLNAVFSTYATINKIIRGKYHVNLLAEADLSILTDEIIKRYLSYMNALMGHDVIFRYGYQNQMDVEASRHRFIGTLNSLYFNKRAEQGVLINGKIIKFQILGNETAQIELEIIFDEYEPRKCYKKLVDGLMSYFHGFKMGNSYNISLRDINEIEGKRKRGEQFMPFINYLNDYYNITLRILE